MKKAFEDYRWLAGTHGVRGSLWQGTDHMLVVEGRGLFWAFVERYRRIDYKNIQALSLVRTSSWIWLGVLQAMGVAGLGMGAWLAYGEMSGLALTLAIAALGLLLVLVVHLQKGPSCRCMVQTSVQVLKLKALKRERQALRVMDALEKICLERQGEMPSSEVPAVPLATAVPGPPGLPTAHGKPAWPGSAWVMAAGVTMLLWGLAVAGELWVNGVAFLVTDVLLGLVAFLLVLVGLVRVMSFSTSPGLKGLMWTSVVLQVLSGVGLYVMFIAVSVMSGVNAGSGGRTLTLPEMAEGAANFSMEQAGVWGFLMMGLGGLLAVLGVLMVAGGWWRKVPQAAVPPPMVASGGQTELRPLQDDSNEGG